MRLDECEITVLKEKARLENFTALGYKANSFQEGSCSTELEKCNIPNSEIKWEKYEAIHTEMSNCKQTKPVMIWQRRNWEKSAQKLWKVVLLQPAYSFSYQLEQEGRKIPSPATARIHYGQTHSEAKPLAPTFTFVWALLKVQLWVWGAADLSTQTSHSNSTTAWEGPNTSEQLKLKLD